MSDQVYKIFISFPTPAQNDRLAHPSYFRQLPTSNTETQSNPNT